MTITITPTPARLTWKNFTRVGSIPGEPSDAQTDSQMKWPQFKPVQKDGKFRFPSFTITVFAGAKGTMVLKTAKQTRELLDHEQGHYDLMILSARALARELEVTEASSFDEIVTVFEELTSKHQQRAADLGEEYDKQTSHSRDVVQQRRWRSMIDNAAATKASKIDNMDL
jgi:hypothetical protein